MTPLHRTMGISLALGLIGPALQAAFWPPRLQSSGGRSQSAQNLLPDLIRLIWPGQQLAVSEAAWGHGIALALSLGANLVLFGILGVAAFVASRSTVAVWMLWLCVGVLVAMFATWMAGFSAAYINWMSVAVALAIYSLPFVVAWKSAPES